MKDDAATATLRRTLREGAEGLGIPLPPEAEPSFLRYAEMLVAANARTNLTRIVDPAGIAVRHFLDSLTVLLAYPDLSEGARLADIGTGAGVPGLPLKIVRPDLDLTLIDSLGKRLTFLDEVVRELGLAPVTLVHARAEDAGRDPVHRERYDLVTARAVATLPILLEWCAPLVRVGGRFVALKSADMDAERDAARNALPILGVRLVRDLSLALPPETPDGEPQGRRVLVYERTRPTPPRFPRRPAEIKAKPL